MKKLRGFISKNFHFTRSRLLKAAALGIAVVQEEGAAAETMMAADVVSPDIVSALNLLVSPLRLVATLRS